MTVDREQMPAQSPNAGSSIDAARTNLAPDRESGAMVAASSPGPLIREATRADSAAIARLITPLGYPIDRADVEAVWSSWTAEGNSALVADEQGSILGVVTLHRMTVLHRPKPVGRITALAVDPAAQRRGIGRRLVEAAEAALAAAGCGLLEVTSHARRAEAHAFYERVGFQRTSFRFARNLP